MERAEPVAQPATQERHGWPVVCFCGEGRKEVSLIRKLVLEEHRRERLR
jgi:hypothetical protein